MQRSNRHRQGPRAAACCGGLGQLLSPRVFKALGDSSRISLLARLAEAGGPCTVGDIAKGSNVDLSVVSRHLAILREAGVIQCVRRGKEVHCTVQGAALARMLRELADAFEACCPRQPVQGESPARTTPGQRRPTAGTS